MRNGLKCGSEFLVILIFLLTGGCAPTYRSKTTSVPVCISCSCDGPSTLHKAIPLKITVSNLEAPGTRAFAFEATGFYLELYKDGHTIPATDEARWKLRQGEMANLGPVVDSLGPLFPDHCILLRPQRCCVFTIDLNEDFQIKEAGEYTVAVRKRFLCPEPVLIGSLSRVAIKDKID